MPSLDKNTALILIDVQKAFDLPRWGKRNNPEAEANMARLLTAWRAAKRPVIHIKHDSMKAESPLHPSHPGNAIKDEVAPAAGEPVLRKSVNSGFIGTDLQQRLEAQKVREVVIVGLTTNHCVSTTVRMAANLGFNVILVDDACATFDLTGHDGKLHTAEELHSMGLAELHGEFAEIVTTAELIEIPRSAIADR